MKSNERISELLVKTGAYKDLDQPVILTSGELGIYYINTEKLCQDDGEFKKYGNNSKAMIQHAIKMTQKYQTFEEVIDILSDQVKIMFPVTGGIKRVINSRIKVLSGGQRRDWLFSGPVARKLNIPHISLYKDGRIEIIDSYGNVDITPILNELYTVHVADLLTEGSSAYRVEDGEEKGWVSMLRNGGATINDYVAVITRLQGGEEMLNEKNVVVHPFVAIDKNFINEYSKYPERAIDYLKNPEAWSKNYLKKKGALALVKAFDPEGGKLDRAKKFLKRYSNVLKESGKIKELEKAVQEKYGKSLNELVGN